MFNFSKFFAIQRFWEVMSVISRNPFLWTFLMENLNLGIEKIFVIPENQVFLNPELPRTSVSIFHHSIWKFS